MEETSSGGTETESDTDACECECAGADTEGTCTQSERGCTMTSGTTGWSPELLGVLLVVALGRWRTRPVR